MSSNQKTLGVLLFDKFELLDVFGPLEMLGYVPDITVHLIAQEAGAVRSTQGPAAMADFSLTESPPVDVLLVPGGLGTRAGVSDPSLLAWIADRSAEATHRVKDLVWWAQGVPVVHDKACCPAMRPASARTCVERSST